MSAQYFWLLYVHVVVVALYVGATAFFTILLPFLRSRLPPGQSYPVILHIIRIYHPLSLTFLGLLILTGAFYLTRLKGVMGPAFAQLFAVLGLKLALVFVLVMTSSFQFFGLGLRLTRARPGGDGAGGNPGEDQRRLRLLERVNRVNLALALLIVYLGLAMGRS
ncbi:MAG: hypothetical protein ACE5JJ_11415 [Nitrospinota bacterium]